MFCKECGTQFETENASVCLNCGMKKGNGRKYCDDCGAEKKSENQDVCLSCGKDFKKLFGNVKVSNNSAKTKLITLLFWFFLGGVGAHCFYVGNKKRGWMYIWLLVATVVTCGIAGVIPAVFIIIDLINILTDKFEDGEGNVVTQWS